MKINNSLGFPIILISLKSDYERRNALKERFNEYYDDFNIIDAIDGREMLAKDYFRLSNKNSEVNKRTLTPGEVGCTLSHIRALNYFLESNADNCLIIEDDIIGSNEDIYEVKSVIKHVKDSDIVICGGQDGLTTKRFVMGNYLDQNVLRVCDQSVKHLYRTCAYFVTKQSGAKLHEYHLANFGFADDWMRVSKLTQCSLLAANIFKHPEDLNNSLIERERLLVKADNSMYIKIISKLKIIVRYALWMVVKIYLHMIGKTVLK